MLVAYSEEDLQVSRYRELLRREVCRLLVIAQDLVERRAVRRRGDRDVHRCDRPDRSRVVQAVAQVVRLRRRQNAALRRAARDAVVVLLAAALECAVLCRRAQVALARSVVALVTFLGRAQWVRSCKPLRPKKVDIGPPRRRVVVDDVPVPFGKVDRVMARLRANAEDVIERAGADFVPMRAVDGDPMMIVYLGERHGLSPRVDNVPEEAGDGDFALWHLERRVVRPRKDHVASLERDGT
mmetsp:Transcript_41204/g.96273  ORF Transcript_41204/g.96273 Transcript_41204/m.96273 type:complete len:240 (-) Transcript_41204:168-887(-)